MDYQKLCLCFFTFSLFVFGDASRGERRAAEAAIRGVLDDKEVVYDPRQRPGTEGPLPVLVDLVISSIGALKEANMEYTLTMYLKVRWNDTRIAYNVTNESVSLDHRHFESLWTPDLFMRNIKSGDLHDLTNKNRLFHVKPNGEIIYSQRLTMTLSCKMMLRRYPMDNQTCHIDIGSYSSSTDDIDLRWHDPAILLYDDISLPEYNVDGVNTHICPDEVIEIGSYPCLMANLMFSRRVRSYLLSTYLPSFLVVVLTWVGFWIDHDSVPARIGISTITILTITTQGAGSNKDLPTVSFVKAIDVWHSTCLFFVFCAFIEFAIVNSINRRIRLGRQLSGYTPGQKLPRPASTVSYKDILEHNPALRVDLVSRILFPVTFLVFNLVYWPYYLLVEE